MKTLQPEELLAGTPLEKDLTFSAPWEARAFAMAARLSESGICTWDEFRRHLIVEIDKGDKVRAHGWVEDGDGYYTYFLRALENLLREKNLVDASALELKMRAITEAGHDDHEH
jgi:nitrile hydratase accessory protein